MSRPDRRHAAWQAHVEVQQFLEAKIRELQLERESNRKAINQIATRQVAIKKEIARIGETLSGWKKHKWEDVKP